MEKPTKSPGKKTVRRAAGPSQPGRVQGQPKAKLRRENPAKRWCFTLNNYTDEDLEWISKFIIPDNCVFAVVGQEIGESGTPHLQGFVNLKVKKRLSQLKELLGSRAHLEQAKGTDQDNDNYCTKDGKVYLRIGEPSTAGKRNDLLQAVELLHSTSGNLTEVARACPGTFIRYGRGLRDYWLTVGATPRRHKTEVYVMVGPPGCGKSKFCFENTEATPTFYKQRGEWWDGYMGQENVIIDDFYGWIKYDEMLHNRNRHLGLRPRSGRFAPCP
jgi:hypothetical protein